MFYNELDVLEIRLKELYDVVDYFIIVEGNCTHTGIPKSFNFEDNVSRFQKYLNKIQYYKLDLPYPNESPGDLSINWYREHYNRDAIRTLIDKLNLNDDDIIISSDLDEIVNSDLLFKILKKDIVIEKDIFYSLEMDLYYYNIETKCESKWSASKLFTYSTLNNAKKTLTQIRFMNTGPNTSILREAGWHLSSFGDNNAVYNKISSIAEAPLPCVKYARDLEFLDSLIKNNIRYFDNVELTHVPLNENTYIPKYFKPHAPVKVSIACLIYKSVRWLKFVKEQVEKYTNLDGNEFYFVANDACDAVLDYLKDNNIHHYVHNNTEEQRKEWYINNVYRAWNTAGRMAKGEYVVFINSDMAFTPGWLDRLLERNLQKNNAILTSRLVERGILSSGCYGIERDFGNVPDDYNEEAFLNFSKIVSSHEVYPSGLYMPCLIKKTYLEVVGYYPEGNIVPGSDIFNPQYALKGDPCISGDTVLIQRLNTIGVKHWSVFDSIVYHFQEGEMRDTA